MCHKHNPSNFYTSHFFFFFFFGNCGIMFAFSLEAHHHHYDFQLLLRIWVWTVFNFYIRHHTMLLPNETESIFENAFEKQKAFEACPVCIKGRRERHGKSCSSVLKFEWGKSSFCLFNMTLFPDSCKFIGTSSLCSSCLIVKLDISQN